MSAKPIRLKLSPAEAELLQRAVMNHVKMLRNLSGQKGPQSYRDRMSEACRTLERLQARLFPPEERSQQ